MNDNLVINLLPPTHPVVNEMMRQLASIFEKQKGFDEAISVLIYAVAMTIGTLPPPERKRLVRAMVKPILTISEDMAQVAAREGAKP
jgi:acyl-CoA reductase-like NAD-dependent aldehyde dehydrogenase